MTTRRHERPPQVNVRLNVSDAEVLAAIAFLNGSSGAEVLRPVIEQFLHDQRNDAEVKAALEIRVKRRAGPA